MCFNPRKLIPELDEEKSIKVSFLKEQLVLSIVSKHGRRYSPNLLAYAALWENTSPALYKQILEEDILALPSQRHLKNLTSAFSVDAGMSKSTEQYLKARISKLNEREKVVDLIIDEVYSSKRVEYSSGTFYGYENQNVTKTLLCFMIKSVGGKYMDMACMSPIDRLDSDVLLAMWDNVLKEITLIGFEVVVNTLDGHSSNRKFYVEKLSNDDLRVCIPHPYIKGAYIYLLFDSVHVFKCIYNNFINKRIFYCPDFDGQKIEGHMSHIEELYKHELGRPVKYAHKLTDKVLHPMPIEKTKVELADRLFHESTIAALDYYSENGFPQWKTTANFLRLIRTMWDIVNVKSKYVGRRKRDPVREPISKDDTGGLQFLEKFTVWVEKWEKMNNKEHSLSKETFLTCKQTMRGLIGVAMYLLEEKNFEYVLLGLITSDPIERRFGWYRQLGGANYYLSPRQFFESEKKIRLQCLIKFGNLSFKEACDILKSAQRSEDTELEAHKLLLKIGYFFEVDFDVNGEEGILYYVAGFASKAELKRISCSSCTPLFVKSKDTPNIELDNDLGERKGMFLEQINRGGLCTPSDAMFVCVLYARRLYEKIFDKGEAEKMFLSMKSQRDVFTACLEKKMANDFHSCEILDQTCEESAHKFSERISSIGARFFNIFSKNFISEINDEIHQGKKRQKTNDPKKDSSARKIKKLQCD